MRRDLVVRNVVEPVQAPRGPKAERFGLTVKQARALPNAAAGARALPFRAVTVAEAPVGVFTPIATGLWLS